jgi:tRNA dihydrouridine synthase A
MNPISIAPMIGWTDRHFRYLFRHIARCPLLYTEMIMDSAILYNLDKLDNFIGYNRSIEPPLALQLGGNSPETLGKAVEACEMYGGFSEINLNCGCPSNKAKRCGFGAELMLEPELVRQIVSEMIKRSRDTEITVKCRIGTNLRDSWDDLLEFVHACRDGGIRKIIVHARICVLCGLSPAQNRTVPPLRYDVVHRLVECFPDLQFVVNGGVKSHEDIHSLLQWPPSTGRSSTTEELRYCVCKEEDEEEEGREHGPSFVDPVLGRQWGNSGRRFGDRNELRESVFDAAYSSMNNKLSLPYKSAMPLDSGPSYTEYAGSGTETVRLWPPVHGVMVGREAYNNPWAWASADSSFYGKQDPGYSRREVLEEYLRYAEEVLAADGVRSSIPYLCKPLHNFFTGCSTNKLYKRHLDHLLKVHVTKQSSSSSSSSSAAPSAGSGGRNRGLGGVDGGVDGVGGADKERERECEKPLSMSEFVAPSAHDSGRDSRCVHSSSSSSSRHPVSFESIIREAVELHIPASFLDERVSNDATRR